MKNWWVYDSPCWNAIRATCIFAYSRGECSLRKLFSLMKTIEQFIGEQAVNALLTALHLNSFAMAELLDSGILIHGEDLRSKMIYPTYAQMRDDVIRHVRAAREHGVVVGWLLDIARGIYTLRTGKIISKTAAGEWALIEGLCPDADALRKTVEIRKQPLCYAKEEKNVDNAVIQRFADVLEVELNNTGTGIIRYECKQ